MAPLDVVSILVVLLSEMFDSLDDVSNFTVVASDIFALLDEFEGILVTFVMFPPVPAVVEFSI